MSPNFPDLFPYPGSIFRPASNLDATIGVLILNHLPCYRSFVAKLAASMRVKLGRRFLLKMGIIACRFIQESIAWNGGLELRSAHSILEAAQLVVDGPACGDSMIYDFMQSSYSFHIRMLFQP